MTQVLRGWTRRHSAIALVALMAVQIFLINHFRTGLLGSDDMTAAFTGKRFVNEFDMTVAFTNLPMSMRMGMGIPLGILQLFMPTDTALWVFPLLCAIPLAPLGYRIARLLRLSRLFSFIAAAMLSCTPAVIFNSSVALTEIPLLVVTLAVLLCLLEGLPRDGFKTRLWLFSTLKYKSDGDPSEGFETACRQSRESVEEAPRWRYGWLLAAGALTGVLFSIKVSAVALIASLAAYTFLRQVSRRRFPWAAVVVCCGFAVVLAGEMGVWASMTGDPLHRSNRIKTALANSRANMREIYQQTSQQDVIAKYGRYVFHFLGKRASFGNLFLLFFAGWAAACLFAKRYRLFLIIYGGPQILYLWYLVTFYPSTQPRYAIQFLPFVVLGTLLLLERWQWSRTGWGTAIIVLLVGQNLAMGMKARSNQYQADTVFFPRYTHEKMKDLHEPVYVDGRTVSIYHTLNNFSPSQQETLWQYPIYRNMRVGERRKKEKKLGLCPWRETNLENAHGFVTVDLRLTRWLRRRLKSPKVIHTPPPNWVLADYAFPEKRPALGGLIYYASPQITAKKINDDPNLEWTAGTRWYRLRRGEEPVEVSKNIVKFQQGDLLVLGEGNITRPGLRFLPEQFTAGDNLFAFVEFDCIVDPQDPQKNLYVPWMRLFDGQETAAKVRFPAALLEAGRHTLRFPVRLSSRNNGLRFCLRFQQNSDVRITVPRVFVQHLEKRDQLIVNRYDGVPSKLANMVSVPSQRKIR